MTATVASTASDAQAIVDAFIRFQNALWELEGVQKLWRADDALPWQFWVLLAQATPELRHRVYALERELICAFGPVPVEVLVYGADEVDTNLLPGGRVLFNRAAGASAR